MGRAATIFATVAVGCLCLPATVGAQEQVTGLSYELSLSANGLTETAYFESGGQGTGLDPLVGLSLAILSRPIPYVSAGALVHYGFFLPDVPEGADALSGWLAVLAEVRGHYPVLFLDPWIGLGLGYAMWHTWVKAEEAGQTAEVSTYLHGVGISIGAGLGFRVGETSSIGPFFRMVFGVWPTACLTMKGSAFPEETDECGDVDDPTDEDLPHLWTVGIAYSSRF